MTKDELNEVLIRKAMSLLGKKTLKKHGKEHFRKIGEKGRKTRYANKRAKEKQGTKQVQGRRTNQSDNT